MALIQVKFDNTLQQSEIRIPLHNSSKEEAGELYENNQPEVQQTHVYGIQAPLIMINNIVVDFSDVISFELRGDGRLPSVSMHVKDRYRLTETVDTPGLDNELRVQILPKFEGKYKKINLTFYITRMTVNNGHIFISGAYKAPKLISNNIKSFGEISTYNLFQTIAQETGLGFATNIEDSGDVRYRYCPNQSYKDMLDEEVVRFSSNTQICDYWVDWWNNLILADIMERYKATDKDEDMQVWVTNFYKEMSEGAEFEPTQIVASFNNHPGLRMNEMYVDNYRICNSPGASMAKGTDRVFAVYESNKEEYQDHLIQEGDAKKDIFTKLDYLGETYGDHNYLLSSKLYDTFKQKMASNDVIEIDIKTPLLGVMRGNRVNFLYYINDGRMGVMQEGLEEMGLVDMDPEANIPMDTGEKEEDMDGAYVLDKSISGQYLVTRCVLRFDDQQWTYTITLARPTSARPNIIIEE